MREETTIRNSIEKSSGRWSDPRTATLATVCLVGTIVIVPPTASAGEVLYYANTAAVKTWKWSGHHNMDGGSAWGTGYLQNLHISSDGYGTASGVDEVYISHA